jgi:hypothetical protein
LKKATPAPVNKKAIGLVTTDKQGYLSFDALIPRRKTTLTASAAAEPAKPKPLHPVKPQVVNNINNNNRSIDRKQNQLILDQLAHLAQTLSDADTMSSMAEASESHFVCRSAWYARSLARPPNQSWSTLSKWIHPKRVDYVGCAQKQTHHLLTHPLDSTAVE